jgi:hypothetical protein
MRYLGLAWQELVGRINIIACNISLRLPINLVNSCWVFHRDAAILNVADDNSIGADPGLRANFN